MNASDEVWYFDTSAFVKLVVKESQSSALNHWLRGRTLASSDLLRTEARRATRGHDLSIRHRCERLLDGLPLIRLSADVFDRAGSLDGENLRSLDALHIAAALTLGPSLAGMVTYDARLASAAALHGCTIVMPD